MNTIYYIYVICLTFFNIYICVYIQSKCRFSQSSFRVGYLMCNLIVGASKWGQITRHCRMETTRTPSRTPWLFQIESTHGLAVKNFVVSYSVIDLILNHTFCSQYVVSIMKHLHIRLDARRPLKQTRPIRRKARRKLLVHPTWVSSSHVNPHVNPHITGVN